MPPASHAKNLIFLFERGHVDAAEAFLKERTDIRQEGFAFVALDPEIEAVLALRGASCISAGPHRTQDASPRIEAADYAQALFESDRWAFFKYRDVSLSRIYTFSLQVYLTELFYQVDIVGNIMTDNLSAARCVVFPPITPVAPMGSCWMEHWLRIPVDVVTHITQVQGKEVVVPASPDPQAALRTYSRMFHIKRAAFGFCITLLNYCVAIVRRPRPIRVLVSDYWGSVAQTLLPLNAEVVFIDRRMALKAGWKNILKLRMRFWHLASFAKESSVERAATAQNFLAEWSAIRGGSKVSPCVFRGFSLEGLVASVLDSIVEEAADKTLKDIDGAHGMLASLRPHLVMLRATTSSQPHFSILAQVARLLGIHSIEMLHGLDYYGPGSSYRSHQAQFVGIYGRLIQKQMEHLGPKDTKLVVLGSPRFDVYAAMIKKQQPKVSAQGAITFLCIAPVAGAGDIDMYDIVEYFDEIAKVLKTIPGARAIIKFRPGPNRDEFVRSVIAKQYAGIPYDIAQEEPLVEVFPRADVVISCFSTAALEALQCAKPVVYFGLSPSQRMLGLSHFCVYKEAGAVRIATTVAGLQSALQELSQSTQARDELVRHALLFLEQEYAFDGHAAERTAKLIQSLASSEKR